MSNGSPPTLPPGNSWQSAAPCSADSNTTPSFVYGITITGTPAMIAATGAAGYTWSITLNDGNSPANFTIDHYDGAGNLIDHPILISGADGSTTFGDPVYLSRDPLQPMEAATKEYVDAAAAAAVFPDAPNDSNNYVRRFGDWVNAAPPTLAYLPLAGGYLSGAVAFNGAAQQRFIAGMTTASIYRWSLQLGDTAAESGGNAGSNFTLTSYTDTGGSPVAQLTITRTGQWIVPGVFQVTGTIQLASPVNLQIGGGSNGNVLTTNGLGQLTWANPGSGGGVPEAPIDANTYGRHSALWTAVPPEAPLNASTYGRSNGAWVVIPPPVITGDAPATSLYYARYNNGWVNIAGAFLQLSGGSMTGAIVFNAAGGGRAIAGQASGAMRWALYVGDATAESGGNSGSNFAVTRYSDAGAVIDTPLSISRATGLVSMPDGATVPTAAPGDSSSLAASTAFVGAAVAAAGGAYVQKAGDTMTGNLAAPSLSASNGVSAPVAAASPVAGDNSLTLATTAWVNGRPLGDNRIINGDMRIDQRNNGAAGSGSDYTVDRWAYYTTQASNMFWGRGATSGLPAFPYRLGFTSAATFTAAAADYYTFAQSIEADMISDFAWGTTSAQPVTLSFWAQSSLTGTFSGSVRNYAGTRSYPFAFSLPTVNAWTRIVITIPGDTAGTWVMSGNAGALNLNFDLGSGANYRGPANAWVSANYNGVTGSVSLGAVNGAGLLITGVKLEIGSVATPFNRQSLAKSLADCQRYYYQPNIVAGNSLLVSGYAPGAQNTGFATRLYSCPVTMRAAPTVVAAYTGLNNIYSAITTPLPDNTTIMGTTSNSAAGQFGANWVITNLSAEL